MLVKMLMLFSIIIITKSEHYNCINHFLRPLGHICPMFFSCICYTNITKKIFQSPANFTLSSFVHITKKKLCNSSFHCLAFGNSIQSTSEFVELWNYGVFRQN